MKLSNTYLCCNCDELLVPESTNNFRCTRCSSSQVYPISKWLPSSIKEDVEEEEDELNLNKLLDEEICQSIKQISVREKRIILLNKLKKLKESLKDLKNYRYIFCSDLYQHFVRIYFKHIDYRENDYDADDDIIEWAFNNDIPIYQDVDVNGTYIKTLQIKPSKFNLSFDRDIILVFHISNKFPKEYKKVQKTMTYSTIVCEKEY